MKTIWKSLDSYLETAADAAVRGFEPVCWPWDFRDQLQTVLAPHCGLRQSAHSQLAPICQEGTAPLWEITLRSPRERSP